MLEKQRIERARKALEKLTDEEVSLLWIMLVGACDWQHGLMDSYSHMKADKEFKHQKAELKAYNRLREKIFPKIRTNIDAIADKAPSVSIFDLAAKKAEDKP